MKRFFLLLLLAGNIVYGQSNYSGTYGYSIAPGTNAHNNEKDATGPTGTLVLQKTTGNTYRFWLDVNVGAPSYNLGETDGLITFLNDTASHDNSYEGAAHDCILRFRINANAVVITSSGTGTDCGFGNRVSAAGTYTRLTTQPKLDNAWLKSQYREAPSITVSSDKAELFQDENALRSFDKKIYIPKGTTLLNVSESEKTIYTEYFDASGKFLFGWVRKGEVR